MEEMSLSLSSTSPKYHHPYYTVILSQSHTQVLVEEEMVVISRVEKLQEELGLALGKEHYSQALHCLDQMAEACPQVCLEVCNVKLY